MDCVAVTGPAEESLQFWGYVRVFNNSGEDCENAEVHQYGPRPQRFFIWTNDERHELGESPLPDGLVRIFGKNGREGLSSLGEQTIHYVPVAADIEVNLGTDDLVVHEEIKTSATRLNFSFDRHDNVNGWDEGQVWSARVLIP